MFNQKHFTFFTLWFMVLVQTLFSQIVVLQGTVTDNGAEYLGNIAEPIANALVIVTDQANANRCFTSYTNEQGQYSIQITQTGVEDDALGKPGDFRLLQNYPNPFNPSTVIGYELSQASHVTIQVYNVLGRKVKTLLNAYQNSSGQVVWDATDDEGKGVPAGVYIYCLEVDGSRIVRKMTLVDGHHNQWLMNPSNAALFETIGKNVLNKQAVDQYFLRITGENIETYEKRDLAITGNLVLDVSVIRTVTDIDGNVYRTVKIGNQWWMAENLKVLKYRNGESIANVTDNSQWATLTTGAWCAYDNNAANADTYGLLYNWYAVNDSRKIAPTGWHVPTDAEWQILVDYLGGSSVAGGKMKEAGTAHWLSPNTGATNESGFSALPGGCRGGSGCGLLGYSAHFWSSTEIYSSYAWGRDLGFSYSGVDRNYYDGRFDFSMRCVRD